MKKGRIVKLHFRQILFDKQDRHWEVLAVGQGPTGKALASLKPYGWVPADWGDDNGTVTMNEVSCKDFFEVPSGWKGGAEHRS